MRNRALQFLIIFFQCSTVISCSEKDNARQKLIEGSIQFWDVHAVDQKLITGSYSFSQDGSCFYYSFKKGVRKKIYDDDLIYPHTWELMGDSILNIQGFQRKILRFTNDTLVLQNIKTFDTLMLVKAD